MPTPPSLTPEQRAKALERAAHVRAVRAEVKAELRAGTLSFTELLARADADEVVARIKVLSALESLPKIGKVKARRLMEQNRVAESRRLSGLGPHQRQALEQATAP
jgi:hypothetical protein